MPSITGTAGNDTLTGTVDSDAIVGLGGDDLIDTLGGIDSVYGGLGNDTIHGGSGTDYLHGDEGNDIITGDEGDDYIYGGVGADTVDGGDGNDILSVRNDRYSGSDLTSGDQFIGGAGYDTILFNGDWTDNWLGFDLTGTVMTGIEAIATELPVFITVGQLSQFSAISGFFRITGSSGSTLDLGNGRFTYGSIYFGSGNDIVTMAGGFHVESTSLDGGGGDDRLTGSESVNQLVGGDGTDFLDGRGGNDSLVGGAGNDTSLGGEGDDTFYDGLGDDVMDGGAGNDVFFVDIDGGVRIQAVMERAIAEEIKDDPLLVSAGVRAERSAGVPNLRHRRSPPKGSKKSIILDLLKSGDGVTTKELQEATGWKPNTVSAQLDYLSKTAHTINRSRNDGVLRYGLA